VQGPRALPPGSAGHITLLRRQQALTVRDHKHDLLQLGELNPVSMRLRAAARPPSLRSGTSQKPQDYNIELCGHPGLWNAATRPVFSKSREQFPRPCGSVAPQPRHAVLSTPKAPCPPRGAFSLPVGCRAERGGEIDVSLAAVRRFEWRSGSRQTLWWRKGDSNPRSSPEAIYTEPVIKTLFTRRKTRNTDPCFAGPRPLWIDLARVVDIRDRQLLRPRV
jgi:hypothetical protein